MEHEKHLLSKGADMETLKKLAEGFTGNFKLFMIPNVYKLNETDCKKFWNMALKNCINRNVLIRLNDSDLIEGYLLSISKGGTITLIIANPKDFKEDIQKLINVTHIHNVRVWNT